MITKRIQDEDGNSLSIHYNGEDKLVAVMYGSDNEITGVVFLEDEDVDFLVEHLKSIK